MAKLDLVAAPPTAVPRRHLVAAPLWGGLAGLLLLVDGADALQTRWAPTTLALVHCLTLGLLGNAMSGSLLQFLPAAAGVRVRGGGVASAALFIALNGGTALLVGGFRFVARDALLPGAAMLMVAFVLLAAMTLPGLVSKFVLTVELRVLRGGLAFAVIAGLATAGLGAALVLGFIGLGGLPALPWTDVHAGWGLLGWTLGLLASVAAVVMPMFQGTRALPSRAQAGWLVAVGLVLGVAIAMAASGSGTAVLRWSAAALVATFAGGMLWLQWRAPRSRNPWLVRSWRAGWLGLLAAAGLVAGGAPALWIGALVLGIALPWLVAGMQLEIVAFLAWIGLHRHCGRGVRLPPVQTLMPETDKAKVFAGQAVAAGALLAAVAWPDVAARPAGAVFACSQLLLCAALLGAGDRADAFARGVPGGMRNSGHAH